jgi:hypothetical protein
VTAPTITEAGPYAVVADAWNVYRRSQQIPMPADGAGDLIAAQRRLHDLGAAPASGIVRVSPAHVAAIADAADNLVAVIEWHCGPAAAAFAAGDGGPA